MSNEEAARGGHHPHSHTAFLCRLFVRSSRSRFNQGGEAMVASPRLRLRWAEAHIKIARMTLTIKLDGNWSSFQLANSAPPLSVTDSAIAPSARMRRSGDNAADQMAS